MTDNIREGGMVKRYHTVPTIGQQTVAEHSFFLCLILTQIYTPSAELLRAALYHDLPEMETGDVPATTKWRYPKLAEELEIAEMEFIRRNKLEVNLTDEEWRALKWADMLELVMYCVDQIKLGNTNMFPLAERGVKYLYGMGELSEKANLMLASLVLEIGALNGCK